MDANHYPLKPIFFEPWKMCSNTKWNGKLSFEHDKARLHWAVLIKNYLEMLNWEAYSTGPILQTLLLPADGIFDGCRVMVFWRNQTIVHWLNWRQRGLSYLNHSKIGREMAKSSCLIYFYISFNKNDFLKLKKQTDLIYAVKRDKVFLLYCIKITTKKL